jgi:putative transposase
MALPRKKYVKEGKEGIYHCFTRCVRRAFLCGRDPISQRDFSHRRVWIVDRLRELAAIFAIEVLAYSVMESHNHTILRTRPDIVASWSVREVATRWLTLFPHHSGIKDGDRPLDENQINTLAECTERIAELRKRLSSLSWFMGRLNEFIARAANKEDNVKGRFWESRFKCLALLDEAAIAACMVYVDLNPIHAGLASTPEDSNFTSIQERIRAWSGETTTADPVSSGQVIRSGSCDKDIPGPEDPTNDVNPIHSFYTPSASWLCPIQSDSEHRGILQMTTLEYFDLVDRSGRILRTSKRGSIDADLAPILLRIGANLETWQDTISQFESRFRLAAGMLISLRTFAEQLGKRWLIGVSAARIAFIAKL